MPLLRRKPFIPEPPPKHLKRDDEIFYCELTGEAFVDYEVFYQRMILCNSLVWSCECTGKPNLTYKEAQDSEESVRKSLESFNDPLRRTVLTLVHHTRRSKIQDLTDQMFDYLKNRYQINEKVEVKVKDEWCNAVITLVPDTVNINLMSRSKKLISPLKSPNTVKENDRPKIKSPLGHRSSWPDALTIDYKVEILKGTKKGRILSVKCKSIRRRKGVFTKDKIKLYLKQTCTRTTVSSDDGFWVVMQKEIDMFSLGTSSITPPEIVHKSPKKRKKKTKAEREELEKSKKAEKLKQKSKEKKSKSISERPKELTLEQKRKEYEKEKERKKLELEAMKIKKLKEKEEEKARKKDEREKEREMVNEVKKLELEFTKEFTKLREDLKLEDSKPLPTFVPLKADVNQNLVGDAIMVVEFVNIFGSLFDLEQEIDCKVTLSWLEEALTEHDAEGKYFQILKFLLHSYLRMEQNQNQHQMDDDDDDDASTSGENTPALQLANANGENAGSNEQAMAKKASNNARAAAVWSMLHQGMALHEITIEPFSLTEVLRLHILSSGVRIGGFVDWNDWQRRGQYQLSDDPCVSFRHKEFDIMSKLLTSSVYDLNMNEKLKLLVLLCNQALMLSATREYMEDSHDKIKSLRKELRELQHEENKRRRKIAQDKWKKKVAERNKHKEEMEKRKKEKQMESQQAQSSTDTSEKISKTAAVASENPKPQNEDKIDTGLKDESDGEVKNVDDNECEKSLEEQQEERKRKKEAKEVQIEEFYREKFLFKERQILDEIAKYSAVLSEVPLGKDRTFRRYWKFAHVDGLLVENDDEGALKLTELVDENVETEYADTEDEDDGSADEDNAKEKKCVPRVTVEDILQAREDGKPLNQLVLNRYKCEYTPHSQEVLARCTNLKPIFENIQTGLDPCIYSVMDRRKWYNINSKEQLEALLQSVNSRGIREHILKTTLSNEKQQILDCFDQAEALREKAMNKKVRNLTQKKTDSDEIDKKLFKTMDDYIEGNLRDQLLEFEERLWVASLGNVKADDRGKWRANIEEGITKLIQSRPIDNSVVKEKVNGDSTIKNEPQKLIELKVLNDDSMDLDEQNNQVTGDTVSSKNILKVNGHIENGSTLPMDVDEPSQIASAKALPLHLKKDMKIENDRSRCSTPVMDVPENEKQSSVRELAEALLQIEKGIERKFLKPPLGESEEIKRERIKEMIEAANTEFELSKGKSGNITEEKEDEEKRPSTCLSRWEESLLKCTNFSQVFVHLNTLDRSVIWDKSIQHVKCRLCRRKGNEEEMLLCDGCDRGFHMSCLKPPLKNVPEGDWFCNDCRPIEVKRRSRKHSSRTQEETEEEEESDEETEEEDDDNDDADDDAADDDDDEDSQSGSEDEEDESESVEEEEEEADDDEEDVKSEASEHGELCTVCDQEGTLILCEDCPRSFHVECCYPPLKKVPRGKWVCQICSGSDNALPYRKRAGTIERQRERAKKEAEKSSLQRTKQQRGRPDKETPRVKQLKRNQTSPPSSRPTKRVKLDNEKEDSQSSSPSSQRSSVGFGRYQLKQCSILINEIFKQDEAIVFLAPVDLQEVPDYTDFIDKPMDFSTIKRNLNTAKYVDIQSFVDDIRLVFTNCEIYNPPRSRVARDGAKLKNLVNKRIKQLDLE